jgi:hypothetical protein
MFETYTLKNFEAIAQNEIKKFTKTYDEWKVSSHSMLVKVPWAGYTENYELTNLEITLVIKTKNEPTRQKTLTIVVDL